MSISRLGVAAAIALTFAQGRLGPRKSTRSRRRRVSVGLCWDTPERAISLEPGAIGDSRELYAGGGVPRAPLWRLLTEARWSTTKRSQAIRDLAASAGRFRSPSISQSGTVDALLLDVQEQTLDGYASISLFSPCATPSCALAESAVILHLTGPGVYLFPFAEFSGRFLGGATDPVDLTAVNLIGLSFESQENAPPGSIRVGPFSTVPESSTALLVLLGCTWAALAPLCASESRAIRL